MNILKIYLSLDASSIFRKVIQFNWKKKKQIYTKKEKLKIFSVIPKKKVKTKSRAV